MKILKFEAPYLELEYNRRRVQILMEIMSRLRQASFRNNPVTLGPAAGMKFMIKDCVNALHECQDPVQCVEDNEAGTQEGSPLKVEILFLA